MGRWKELLCHGFHDAADHNAVGQNIEVIVAPFVGQTAHVDRKAVRRRIAQPSEDAASNSSARRRSALCLLARRRGLPTISLSGGRCKLCLQDDLGTKALGR